MNTKNITLIVLASLVAAFAVFAGWYFVISPEVTSRVAKGGRPNFIILLADDVGYADFQTYGHPTQEWTAVDRMVVEGIKLTNFHSPSTTCSPSRAAILTGRYPIRTGVFGKGLVFASSSSGGLRHDETTVAKAVQHGGYITGMNGKWHLGNNEKTATDGAYLPYHYGFDHVGTTLPYSQMWECDPKKYTVPQMKGCFLYQNDTIVEQPINLNTLTGRLVNEAKAFIRDNRDQPFFFLLSFPQTHSAVFASTEFIGKSKRGIYGDAINEMGWGIGEVLDYLIELGIEKDTLVVFLSDHGPLKDGCKNGGSTGFFRGGKTTTWEGGIRVPAVAWWPGTIPRNSVSDALLSNMDLFPTILKLAGVSSKFKQLSVDGKDISGILKSENGKSPHEMLFYYHGDLLTAVRYDRYKIHYRTMSLMKDVMDGLREDRCFYGSFSMLQQLFSFESRGTEHDPPLIFDLDADPEELVSLDTTTPELNNLLETVKDLLQSHKLSIVSVESEIDKPGVKQLHPCCNPPTCTCNYNEEILK
uniref:arylsulfatase-like n=1 Tax=Styela clava TaxID=7725 RepID=UPI00193A7F3D|nr:arylsulfatase-like [Styela clava]